MRRHRDRLLVQERQQLDAPRFDNRPRVERDPDIAGAVASELFAATAEQANAARRVVPQGVPPRRGIFRPADDARGCQRVGNRRVEWNRVERVTREPARIPAPTTRSTAAVSAFSTRTVTGTGR